MHWNLLRLKGVPIYEQLQVEEALLRTDDQNWCILNEGTDPAIVMGISAKAEQVIDLPRWKEDPVPIYRRFSGGGTVVVDANTAFVSFICNAEEVGVPSYTHDVLRWSEVMYAPVFPHAPFALNENDYVIGEKKIGGNAQYLSRKRWVHHTTFLWDWEPQRMQLLCHPPKEPAYRKKRHHDDFLLPLQTFFPSQEAFFDSCLVTWRQRHSFSEVNWDGVQLCVENPHRQMTKLIRL